MEYIYSVRCESIKRRKILVDLCGTRWSERDMSYERFYLAIPVIAESFEIINRTHLELGKIPKTRTTGWDFHAKRDVTNFLNALSKFEFIVGIISLYRLLHPVAGISDKLQDRIRDITEVYESVNCCVEDIKYMRENVVKEFDQNFNQAKRMAIKLDAQPTLPRRVARLMYLNNVPAEIPKKYFEGSLAIPILGNFISELKFSLMIYFNDQ